MISYKDKDLYVYKCIGVEVFISLERRSFVRYEARPDSLAGTKFIQGKPEFRCEAKTHLWVIGLVAIIFSMCVGFVCKILC